MRIHTEEKPYLCRHCDQAFFSEQETEERDHINIGIVKKLSHKKTIHDTFESTH